MSLLPETPDIAAAVNAEQANRNLAFLPSPPICGLPVRAMNLRHHLLLVGCRNRFVCRDGRPLAADVLFFLWVLSPDYSPEEKKRNEFVAGVMNTIDFVSAFVQIYVYLDRVWQDWPWSEGVAEKSYVAPAASIIDRLASEYGWSDEAILAMPLARVFQYLRQITMRNNPKAIMFNRSDRAIAETLRARMGLN